MRSAIALKPVDSGSISVTFTGEQAIVVQAVTNLLAEFIEADAVRSESTPTSGQPANIKPVPAPAGTPPLAAAAIKAQLQHNLYLVTTEIDHLSEEQAALQAESVTDQNKLEGLESRVVVHTHESRPTVHTVDPAAQERATLNQQLTAERQHLASLRERYTEAYPDVQTSEELISVLEGKIAALPAPITSISKAATNPNDYEQQIDRLTVDESRIGEQLRANDRQIASLKQKRSALQSALLDSSLLIVTPSVAVTRTPVTNEGNALSGQSELLHPFRIVRKASSSVEVGLIDRRIIFSIAAGTLLFFLLCVVLFLPMGNRAIISVEDLKRNLPRNVPYLGEIRRIVP
jgi:predicted nuclease with TOPRIM domain